MSIAYCGKCDERVESCECPDGFSTPYYGEIRRAIKKKKKKNMNKDLEKQIKEITRRLLIPCGYAEVGGETHTKYICIGNLIEELANLIHQKEQEAVRKLWKMKEGWQKRHDELEEKTNDELQEDGWDADVEVSGYTTALWGCIRDVETYLQQLKERAKE